MTNRIGNSEDEWGLSANQSARKLQGGIWPHDQSDRKFQGKMSWSSQEEINQVGKLKAGFALMANILGLIGPPGKEAFAQFDAYC